MLPVLMGFILFAFWIITQKKNRPAAISNGLNVIGLVLIIVPLFQIISFQFTLLSAKNSITEALSQDNLLSFEANEDRPDIYLIVLDMYPRADYLAEVMNFDNSDFLDQLDDREFFVAECALSNYSITRFSLSALLNMNYLDTMLPTQIEESVHRSLVDPLINQSRVRQSLESLNYQVIAFETGFDATELKDADQYFEYVPETPLNETDLLTESLNTVSIFDRMRSGVEIILDFVDPNEFEWLLIETSLSRIFTDFLLSRDPVSSVSDDYSRDLRRYELSTFLLNELETLPAEVEGPKFVFAHIVSPHPPFVFNSDGTFHSSAPDISEEAYYIEAMPIQIQYLNQQMILIIDKIIANSSKPPIIIIQGDHGPPVFDSPGYQENEILSAYYFPDDGGDELASNISPVNLFRHIFNYYFNADFSLLENKAFTSHWVADPYAFEPVTETNATCLNAR